MSATVTLSEWITKQRTDRGLSQQGLGDAVGLQQTRIAKWESGEAAPTLCEGALLFRALGTPDAEVLALLRDLCGE